MCWACRTNAVAAPYGPLAIERVDLGVPANDADADLVAKVKKLASCIRMSPDERPDYLVFRVFEPLLRGALMAHTLQVSAQARCGVDDPERVVLRLAFR